MRDILVIGSLNMDMVVRVQHIPKTGETVTGALQAYVPGGKGANQACACSRMGQSTAILGKVGNDAFGDKLMQNLTDAGVDTTNLSRSDEQTGLALIHVNDAGGNSITVLPGANLACDASFIRAHEQEIMQSRFIVLQMEIPHEAVCEAIAIAKRHHKTVILNPAPSPDRIPEDILACVDYLIPNESEIELLTGLPVQDLESAEKAAQLLVQWGVPNIVVTLGSRGALFVNKDSSFVCPASKVHAVDTTAAGDTFIGGFTAELAAGASVERAISFANAAAGISVTRRGAQTSIPLREEVLKAYSHKENEAKC